MKVFNNFNRLYVNVYNILYYRYNIVILVLNLVCFLLVLVCLIDFLLWLLLVEIGDISLVDNLIKNRILGEDTIYRRVLEF